MTTSSASYLIPDRQGSIMATANVAGAVTANQIYDAYGGPNAWGGTRFAYTRQAVFPALEYAYDPRGIVGSVQDADSLRRRVPRYHTFSGYWP